MTWATISRFPHKKDIRVFSETQKEIGEAKEEVCNPGGREAGARRWQVQDVCGL